MKTNSKIKEKRQELRALSAPLKELVKIGAIESVNEGLKEIYADKGHTELKTVKQWNKAGKRIKKGEKALLLWGKPKKIDLKKKDEKETEEAQYYPICFVFSKNQVHETETKYYKSNISAVRLVREKTNFKKMKITSSKNAAEYARNFFTDDLLIYESTFILLLNRSNNVDAYAKISQGGISGTIVDIRLIAKYALDTLASGVILIHNHPSGNLNPSPQDEAITHKTKEALKLIDVQFLDHLILAEEGYYSFADSGLI